MITHLKDPNSENYIVFIHGLGGSINTWSRFVQYLRKKQNLEISFLLRYFKYYKNIIDKEWIPFYFKKRIVKLIFDLIWFLPGTLHFLLKILLSKRNTSTAEKLSEYININCHNSNNIILVAHSMGGLIARQYLINCRKNKDDISKFKMLITYATPHNGSHRANLVSIKNIYILGYLYEQISNLFNYRIAAQIGDLSSFSGFIHSVNKDWTDYDLERKIAFLRIVAKNDFLVKPESARLHDNDLDNIHEFNYAHSSIINPSPKLQEFPPIDVFIAALNKIQYDDDVKLSDEEMDNSYDNDSENIETY